MAATPFDQMSVDQRRSLAAAPTTDSVTLEALLGSGDNESRIAAACHPRMPPRVLQAAVTASAVAGEFLIGLATHRRAAANVLRFVAQRYASDEMDRHRGIRCRDAADEHACREGRMALAENRATPSDVIESFLPATFDELNDRALPERALRHPALSLGTLESWSEQVLRFYEESGHGAALDSDVWEPVAFALATNPSTPPECLIHLLEPRVLSLREAVLAHPLANAAVLRHGAAEMSERTAALVVQLPACPVEVMEIAASRYALGSEEDPAEHIRAAIAEYPAQLPRALVMSTLAEEKQAARRAVDRRANLASRTDLPGFVLEDLATDYAPAVRAAVASNAATPESTVLALRSDTDPMVAASAHERETSVDELAAFVETQRPSPPGDGVGL